MKWNQLKKRLSREIKAHPIKALVLLGVLGVAAWMWVPAMFQWTQKQTSDERSAEADGPATSGATPSPQKAGDWRSLARVIDQDASMSTADLESLSHSPFGLRMRTSSAGPDGPAVERITADRLGLELTSVIVGRDRSTALVNGQPVQPGEPVETAVGTGVLSRVLPDRVIVEVAGMPVEIGLVHPASTGESGRIERRSSRKTHE